LIMLLYSISPGLERKELWAKVGDGMKG
jgi:hypothetical protein